MIKVTDKGIWMNPTLKMNLDSILHNTRKDWSFLIIISGSKKTRIGKSVLAQQIGYYLAHSLGRKFTVDNICLDGKSLIDISQKLSPGVFVLDESRSDLSSGKHLVKSTQILIDFFNESGKLNNIVILVIPDFFDLMKPVAVGLSHCLINVFISKKRALDKNGQEVVEFKRGYYSFYSDDKKNDLYINHRQKRDYNAVKWNFWGDFQNKWVIDVEEYDRRKHEYIFRQREREWIAPRHKKWIQQRDFLIQYINKENGLAIKDIEKMFEENGFKEDTKCDLATRIFKKNFMELKRNATKIS